MEEGGIIAAAVAQAWIHISMTFLYILLSTPNKAAESFPIILRRKYGLIWKKRDNISKSPFFPTGKNNPVTTVFLFSCL